MVTLSLTPARPRAGSEFTIHGSGLEASHVRVSVSYLHRAETYKAEVASTPKQADGESDEDFAAREERWDASGFKDGDISLTEHAVEAGEVQIAIWDWWQEHVLAETKVTFDG